MLAERAARQRRQTAQQLLEDYAAFAAWSYGAQLREAVLEAGCPAEVVTLSRKAAKGPTLKFGPFADAQGDNRSTP